jgi:hypothetical protein
VTVWKSVPKFTSYEVSEHGAIRMIANPSGRNTRGVRLRPGQLVSQSSGGKYAVCTLWSDEGKSVYLTVHNVVASAFLPPPEPTQYLVRHKDGNGHHNHYTNLLWGTDKDNSLDTIGHGRVRNQFGLPCFGKTDVLLLRNEFNLRKQAGEKGIKRRMANELGVNYWTLRDALNGKSYAWVTAK